VYFAAALALGYMQFLRLSDRWYDCGVSRFCLWDQIVNCWSAKLSILGEREKGQLCPFVCVFQALGSRGIYAFNLVRCHSGWTNYLHQHTAWSDQCKQPFREP
jgi:hypothetical protein